MSKAKVVKSAYEELGFPDADEMLLKAQLAVKIAEALRKRNWSQQQAAEVLCMTQPKLSKMLRGQFRGISETKMMDCLVPLGRGVKIVVGPEGKKAARRVEVVAAQRCRSTNYKRPRKRLASRAQRGICGCL